LNNKDKVADVENEYANLNMRIGESPLDYKLRLDKILQRLKAVGVDVENIPTYSDEMQATRYMRGLDPVRFGSLNLFLIQQLALGEDKNPTTTQDAYELVESWMVEKSNNMQSLTAGKVVFAATLKPQRKNDEKVKGKRQRQ
jgi:hypothetical protein